MICIQVFADDRGDARRFLALGADIRILPFHPVHIGRRAAQVAQISFESGIWVISLTSFNMDSLLREAINFP